MPGPADPDRNACEPGGDCESSFAIGKKYGVDLQPSQAPGQSKDAAPAGMTSFDRIDFNRIYGRQQSGDLGVRGRGEDGKTSVRAALFDPAEQRPGEYHITDSVGAGDHDVTPVKCKALCPHRGSTVQGLCGVLGSS